jgi:hypothetical protein
MVTQKIMDGIDVHLCIVSADKKLTKVEFQIG